MQMYKPPNSYSTNIPHTICGRHCANCFSLHHFLYKNVNRTEILLKKGKSSNTELFQSLGFCLNLTLCSTDVTIT